MSTEIVKSNILEGEFLHEFKWIEKDVSPDEIETIVKTLPATSFLRIYHKVFDTDSHILKINGNWHFWNDYLKELQTWDWKKDIDGIISDLDSSDELDEFNSGWSIYDDGEWWIESEYDVLLLLKNINTLA